MKLKTRLHRVKRWIKPEPLRSFASLMSPGFVKICREALTKCHGEADVAIDYLMYVFEKAPSGFPPPGFTEEEFGNLVELMVREIVHAPTPVFVGHIRLRWDREKRAMVDAETGAYVDWRRQLETDRAEEEGTPSGG